MFGQRTTSMTSPESEINRAWVTAGTSRLWGAKGTYSSVAYDRLLSLPSVDPFFMWLAMLRALSFFILLSAAFRCHAEPDLMPDTMSPDKRLAFAVNEHEDRLWIVRLPSLMPIGNSLPHRDFRGLRGRGGAVWNQRAKRVAVIQGGIPFGETRVFQYSGDLLKELPLPDLEALPRKWFPKAAAAAKQARIYITARRWYGPNKLELTISGWMSSIDTNKPQYDAAKYLEYVFRVLVGFDRKGGSRIIHVKEDT